MRLYTVRQNDHKARSHFRKPVETHICVSPATEKQPNKNIRKPVQRGDASMRLYTVRQNDHKARPARSRATGPHPPAGG